MISLVCLTLQHEFACATRMCMNNWYETQNTYIKDFCTSGIQFI